VSGEPQIEGPFLVPCTCLVLCLQDGMYGIICYPFT